MDIAALGLRVDGVENIDKATKSLEDFSGASNQAAKSTTAVASGAKSIKPAAESAASATDKLSAAELKLARDAERAGMSVKQLQFALRGVPAQFTDIAVSLQGGMNPLTVFLQQGGQLKDMFGGAGIAAKALGGYIVGLVNPLSVAATSVVALGAAYYQGSKEADVFRSTLAQTGNSAGVTVGNLQEYARQMAATSGTQGKAAESLNLFVAAGVRAQDNLVRFAQTAQRWEKATGEGVDAVAEKFAALQKEPVTAALKLNDSMNFLTVSVYSQITALEEQGKATEAARVAMEALDSAMAERAKNIEQNLGYIERAWNGITGAAKRGWDAMLDVGRPDTTVDKIRKIQEEIDRRMTQPLAVDNPAMRASREKGIANLQRELMALQALHAQEELGAAGDAERLRQVQARAAWDKITAGNLDKQAKMEAELTKVREAALQAGIQGKELEDQLAAVREKYKEKVKKESTATVTAYQTMMIAINEKIAASEQEILTGEKQTEADKLRVRYQQELITRGREFNKVQRANIEAGIEQYAAQEAYNESVKYAQKSLDDYAKKQDQQIQKVSEQVEKLRLEEDGHKMAAAENITHAEAMERLTLARLEDARAQMMQGAGTDEEIARLDREIAKRRELLELMGAKGTREANEKAAKELEKQWEKTAQTVGDTLTDYIMGGGKDAATYLKRLFSTLVLQPVVQGVVGGVLGTGAAGASGVASGGIGGFAGIAQNVNSIYGALTGSLTYGLGSAAASIGAAIGSTAATSFGAGMAASGFTANAFTTGASLVGSGATGAGLGMMAGAALPWVAGAAALYSIIKGFDNSGTPHMGAGAIYSAGSVTGGRDIYNRATFGMGARGEWSASNQDAISGIAGALGKALDGVATSFGQKAGYSIYTAFADDSSKDGAWGSLRIADALGNTLVDWEQARASKWAPREFSNGEEGYKEYLNSVAQDVKSAFVAMDLPAWADNLLNAANDLDTLNAALNQIAANKAGFDALAASMSIFKGISDELQTQLLATSGSMDALASVAGSYYGSSMYTEGERMLSARQQQMDALASRGLYIDPAEGDKAKALFRQTVEEAMRSGQGELAVQLMAMSVSFSQTADYAQKLIDEMSQLADETETAAEVVNTSVQRMSTAWSTLSTAAGMAFQFSGDTSGLEAQLDILRGNYGGSADSRLSNLQQQISIEQQLFEAQNTARQEEIQAAQARISAAQQELANAKQLQEAAKGLRNFVEQLRASEASGASEIDRLMALRSQYSAQLGLVKSGDVGAMSDIQGTTTSLLDLSRAQASTAFDYAVTSGIIASELEAAGVVQESSASSMASLLEQQIEAEEKRIEDADKQFKVSDATKKLINDLLNESLAEYAKSAERAKLDYDQGLLTNELLAGLPDGFSTALNNSVVPAINSVAAAAWAAIAAASESSKTVVDGSHASGLMSVPFDGYIAELHKGEAVIPRQYNTFNRQSTGSAIAVNDDLRMQNAALLGVLNQTLRILRQWNIDGLPSTREEYQT